MDKKVNVMLMNEELIDKNASGLWRYAKALPLENPNSAISLGEQTTPLVKRDWSGHDVHFKYEILPTGSYKDRGVAVMLNKLLEEGATAVHEDSSGNAGASLAGYCAAAAPKKIPCEIFVPESTSKGKCVQIEAYGAKLIRVPGPREAASRAAENYKKDDSVYASHNHSPYFAHGVKTCFFEIWEGLRPAGGQREIDAVIVPCGQGSLVLGAWFAFNELLRGGAIKKMPRIYAVQGASCAPLFNAWKNNLDYVPEIEAPVGKNLAEGIVSTRIIRGKELLHAVRESGGGVVVVENDAIGAALLKLARMGLYVEPTSAVVGAALDDLFSTGKIKSGENVVAVLSSSGLKTTPYIQEILEETE